MHSATRIFDKTTVDLLGHRFVDGRGHGLRSGFSIVEALIAAALLLIVTLGVLPFFTRAIVDNAQGARSSDTANLARSKLEELYQLALDSPTLTIPGGDNQRRTVELWSRAQEKWIDEASWSGPETPAFTRTVLVRQFAIDALDDDDRFDEAEALPAGTTPSFVHLKEIEVEIKTPDQLGPLGPRRSVTLKIYKPF